MNRISRRALLGAPIAGAGALLLACQARSVADPAQGSSNPSEGFLARDSPYLLADHSPVYDQKFAAFATRHSLEAGDELQIRMRSQDAVDIEVVRVGALQTGRFGTTVARFDNIDLARTASDTQPLDWPIALSRRVPREWRSGLYAAVVFDRRDPSRRRFAPFVVRSSGSPKRIVVSVPFTRYHAYNAWGGASLYPFNSPAGVASEVSIARPFDVHDGAGFMFYGDWQLATWLEREQYEVSYITSFDLHRDQHCLDGAAVLVSAFHDEYWSTPMRNTLERFIDAGGSAMFLAANSIYWRVRLDESTMICHKAASASDDPHPDVTATWRSELINRPEHLILGSEYHDYEFPYGAGFDWTVAAEDHWLYEGTGLSNGATLKGLIGYEWDRAPNRLAAGTTVLAHTDFVKANGEHGSHDATELVHPGGGTVVNVGTTYWPRFLIGDDAFLSSAAVQQMTRNMLDRLGGTGQR